MPVNVNVFNPGWERLSAGFSLRGNWNTRFFNNNNPVIIEMGCGKGEYTVDLSSKYLSGDFIGIDKKGARMWRGTKTSNESASCQCGFRTHTRRKY
ncbi:MAG: hypothetical protein U0Z17_10255 [Bacteroidales bacterium]